MNVVVQWRRSRVDERVVRACVCYDEDTDLQPCGVVIESNRRLGDTRTICPKE